MGETVEERADRLFGDLLEDCASVYPRREIFFDFEEMTQGQDTVRAALWRRIRRHDSMPGGFCAHRTSRGRVCVSWLFKIGSWDAGYDPLPRFAFLYAGWAEDQSDGVRPLPAMRWGKLEEEE